MTIFASEMYVENDLYKFFLFEAIDISFHHVSKRIMSLLE